MSWNSRLVVPTMMRSASCNAVAARSGQNTELSAGSGLRPVGGEHVALPGGGAGQGLRAADEIRLSRIG